MRIEYIWFEKYNHLNDFEANLGSIYNYSYDRNNEIKIFEDKKYIKNYFHIDDKKRIDLTAIVGSNGVGKSSLLDFLSDVFRGTIAYKNKFLIIYDVNNKKYIYKNFKEKIQFKNYTNEKIKIQNKSEVLQHPIVLFFSNVFDVRYITSSNRLTNRRKNFYNISTNALLYENEIVEQFLTKEFEKQIILLIELGKDLDVMGIIKTPQYIQLECIDDLSEVINYPTFIEEGYLPLEKRENPVREFLGKEVKDPFKNAVLRHILVYFFIKLNELLNDNKYSFNEYIMVDKIYMEYGPNVFKLYNNINGKSPVGESNNILDYFGDWVITYLENETNAHNKGLGLLKEDLNKLIGDFRNLIEIIIELDVVKNSALLNLSEMGREKALIETKNENTSRFIKLYRKVFDEIQILSFSWLELSSGQYGMLSLFARFYSIIKEVSNQQENSFLILIDEGDLYFHPQWQKDWLFYFLQLVNKIFDKDIQIILTTHSPLVLSDFPNSNVIFMEDAILRSNQLEGSPRTLGANVIELFSNSFFIKDGLVGKYAKNQINEFTRNLIKASPKDIYENRKYYEKFIENLGEALVRGKLVEIYRDKMNLYTGENIEDRIKRLEMELEQLKKGR